MLPNNGGLDEERPERRQGEMVGRSYGKCSWNIIDWQNLVFSGEYRLILVRKASLIEMDTCSRISSYDYPWQATFPNIMIHLKYELKTLTNFSIASHQHAPKKLTDEAKFLIFIICIFLILAAIGTVITAYDSYYRPKKKRRSSDGEINIKKHIHSHVEKTSIESCGDKKDSSKEECFRKLKTFFNCFCIYTNGGRILSTTSNDGEFLWLHGIRFIGAFWIIAIHVGLFYFNSLSDVSPIKLWRNHWTVPVFLNASCVISLFFVLSGFLNGYFTSRDYLKNGGTISWLRFYRKRLLRVVPLYAMIFAFYSVLFSYTGSGPVWPAYDTNPVCKESWWWNLIFLNNFQSSWKQCYTPAWYIAADMQLLLISPIFLISLFKWPRFGYTLTVLSICASCSYRSVMTIKYDLLDSISSLLNYVDDIDKFLHRNWIFVDIIHIKPVSNLGAYLIGLGLGHYLWKREMCKKGKNNMIALCCGWIGFAVCRGMDYLRMCHKTRRFRESFAITKNLPPPVTSIVCCISDQLYRDTTLFLFFNKASRTFQLFILDRDYILLDFLDLHYILYNIAAC
ncbi:nose resistant to fluoxetine protein 6 [Trichonephila inaurata madagascariensis]|uniref:Nose resistant to fluoxetine protein 6 n=1 Tax=Trichonephila inaurata madagascariensis TaxID=2747483 RepID=A0A8X7CBN6_9ARAC|nr:nose resistant to fluoxetine protein 6 [Trichonephila inaurata madagascariensis]